MVDDTLGISECGVKTIVLDIESHLMEIGPIFMTKIVISSFLDNLS